MKRLEGRVAVVTGGNTGVGLATAKLLVEHGAKVAIAGGDAATPNAAADFLGASAIAVQCDVNLLADLNRLFATVHEKFGKIDILFANAGIALAAPLRDAEKDIHDEVSNISAKGVLFGPKRSSPHFNEGAAIVLNTSFADDIGLRSDTPESVSKRTAALVVAYALVAKIGVGAGLKRVHSNGAR